MRCLDPRRIEDLVAGRLSARRAAVTERHVSTCRACADAVAEARRNETWLQELRDSPEVSALRRTLAQRVAPPTTVPPHLTGSRSD